MQRQCKLSLCCRLDECNNYKGSGQNARVVSSAYVQGVFHAGKMSSGITTGGVLE